MSSTEIQLVHNGRSYRMEWEECPDRIYHQTFLRGERCSAHSHPSYHLRLVTAGACCLSIEGYPPAVLPENSLVMINPTHKHRFIFDQSDVCIHNPLIWRFCDENGELLTESLQNLFGGPSGEAAYEVRVLSSGQVGDFLRLHRDLEQFFWGSSQYVKSAKLFSLMILAVDMLWRWNWKKNSAANQLGNSHILKEKILYLIDMYFWKESFSAERVAAELDRSLHYLNGIMLREMGSGVAALLRRRRLKHARYLLEITNLPIKTVAIQCGFSSIVYFSAAFKHENGMTASEYRRQYNDAIKQRPLSRPVKK